MYVVTCRGRAPVFIFVSIASLFVITCPIFMRHAHDSMPTARGAGQAAMEIEQLVKKRGNICGIVRFLSPRRRRHRLSRRSLRYYG